MKMAWLGWLLLAPLMEELVFRGGLHTALLRRPQASVLKGAGRVNLLVAAVFGLAHALTRSVVLGLATLPMALFIGWVFERTGRVRHCVLIHAACNATWFAVSGNAGVAGGLA
jgi:membrane protease YdiL (CAAX protease family)